LKDQISYANRNFTDDAVYDYDHEKEMQMLQERTRVKKMLNSTSFLPPATSSQTFITSSGDIQNVSNSGPNQSSRVSFSSTGPVAASSSNKYGQDGGNKSMNSTLNSPLSSSRGKPKGLEDLTPIIIGFDGLPLKENEQKIATEYQYVQQLLQFNTLKFANTSGDLSAVAEEYFKLQDWLAYLDGILNLFPGLWILLPETSCFIMDSMPMI
jgi:hypothetical protein